MSKTPLRRLGSGAFGTLEIPRLERSVLARREQERLAKLACGMALKDWIKL